MLHETVLHRRRWADPKTDTCRSFPEKVKGPMKVMTCWKHFKMKEFFLRKKKSICCIIASKMISSKGIYTFFLSFFGTPILNSMEVVFKCFYEISPGFHQNKKCSHSVDLWHYKEEIRGKCHFYSLPSSFCNSYFGALGLNVFCNNSHNMNFVGWEVMLNYKHKNISLCGFYAGDILSSCNNDCNKK